MKKLIYFAFIIVGIILVIVGSLFIDNKEVKKTKLNENEIKEEKLVKNQLNNAIKDSLSKDSSAEILNKKYQIEEISDAHLPFSSVSILRFGLDIDSTDETKDCLDFVQKNYELVHQRYMEGFDYTAEIDTDNKAISLKIKSMLLESYTTEFSDMTLNVIDASRADLIETFIARCKILKEIQPQLKRYDNSEYNMTARIKYEIVDGEVKFKNFIEILNVLPNKNQPDLKKEKSRDEFIKQVSDKIKKEEK